MNRIEVALDTKNTFAPGDSVYYYSKKRIVKGIVRATQFYTTFLTQFSEDSIQTVECNQKVYYIIEHNGYRTLAVDSKKVSTTEEELLATLKNKQAL